MADNLGEAYNYRLQPVAQFHTRGILDVEGQVRPGQSTGSYNKGHIPVSMNHLHIHKIRKPASRRSVSPLAPYHPGDQLQMAVQRLPLILSLQRAILSCINSISYSDDVKMNYLHFTSLLSILEEFRVQSLYNLAKCSTGA